ncbi:hypothetical protein OS175_02325 [Marinicella sp. S1101]|uniref:FmdB family zinc ribbon protein n=1 Tax=Marinicella marina TaxID=2996016 RepID=UPI002260BF61|nr:zinc ribbon domain-containing protein [Marinicella marina]MCX7552702.1 hypothetical protein [Marinicella marina]MDJ1139989.1 zinc ribbon domain-containing protein [Marinicella marina]
MPIYTYENLNKDQHCTYCLGGFDVMQKLSDKKLTHCTYCGYPVKKIIRSVNLQGSITGSSQSTLSQKNIEKQGFTQYRKVGKGKYEKSAGKGPDTIDAD